jgi:hypothetical protein
MDVARLFGQAVFATVALAFLVWVGVQAVRLAKKGSPGAEVLGAAFLLFSLGNFRDPLNEMVQEAKRPKRREEDDSGDPLNEGDNDNLPPA